MPDASLRPLKVLPRLDGPSMLATGIGARCLPTMLARPRSLPAALAAALALCATPLALAGEYVPHAIPWKPVARGVHQAIWQTTHPLAIHVLSVDLRDPEVRIYPMPGQDDLVGRERPGSVAQRLRAGGVPVVAAVNGDFGGSQRGVRRNNPAGMIVRDGQVFSTPRRRSVAWIDAESRAHISQFDFRLRLESADGSTPVPIDCFNHWYDFDSARLFSPLFGQTEPGESPLLEVMLVPERSTAVLAPGRPLFVETRATTRTLGGNPITTGTLTLQTRPTPRMIRLFERAATRFSLHFDLDPGGARIRQAWTGGPRVVRDGRTEVPFEQEGLSRPFADSLHPRTGTGITSGGRTLLFVVVDGRQEGWSRGVNLYEFGELFVELGAEEALNQDGGGSSCFWVQGEILNRPSDPQGERAVTSTIAVSAAPASAKTP